MKIHTGSSSRFFASQIQRIEEGFVALGHELTPYAAEADLIYVNNPPFTAVVEENAKLWGKAILNVQDIPHHIPDYDTGKLTFQLGFSDAVTSISETTRRDLLAATGDDSHVIYQPIMPITRTREHKHPFRVLFIGRISDGNKRTMLAVHALQMLGFRPEEIVTVGNQPPWYGGVYWGVAAEGALNDLYNSADFVVMVSKNEGMGLPALEAMAAGAIPLICSDLTTREEFFPSSLFPEYLECAPDPRRIAGFIARFMQDNGAMEGIKDRLHQHYQGVWAHRLSGRGVAEAILRVYEGLK